MRFDRWEVSAMDHSDEKWNLFRSTMNADGKFAMMTLPHPIKTYASAIKLAKELNAELDAQERNKK
jgi:hypothetical protein